MLFDFRTSRFDDTFINGWSTLNSYLLLALFLQFFWKEYLRLPMKSTRHVILLAFDCFFSIFLRFLFVGLFLNLHLLVKKLKNENNSGTYSRERLSQPNAFELQSRKEKLQR
jgi:hypothetical protein